MDLEIFLVKFVRVTLSRVDSEDRITKWNGRKQLNEFEWKN